MRPWIFVMLLTTGASLAVAAPASACSCDPRAIILSNPAHGATGVPRNQALSIAGAFVASSVRLEDASGQAVAFDVRSGPTPGCEGTSADVIAKEPLLPNARYTLRVEPLYPGEAGYAASTPLTFTTGTELLPEISLAVPTLRASVRRDGPPSLCGLDTTVYACVDTGGATDVELTMLRGQEVLLRAATPATTDAVYGVRDVPDCIELRRRSPTGQLSPPQSICGAALDVRAATQSDLGQGAFRCYGGVFGATAPDAGVHAALDAGVIRRDRPDASTVTPVSRFDAGMAAASNEDGSSCALGTTPRDGLALLLAVLALRRRRRA